MSLCDVICSPSERGKPSHRFAELPQKGSLPERCLCAKGKVAGQPLTPSPLRGRPLAAARSRFGSCVINAIHYRNAATLPLGGSRPPEGERGCTKIEKIPGDYRDLFYSSLVSLFLVAFLASCAALRAAISARMRSRSAVDFASFSFLSDL